MSQWKGGGGIGTTYRHGRGGGRGQDRCRESPLKGGRGRGGGGQVPRVANGRGGGRCRRRTGIIVVDPTMMIIADHVTEREHIPP